MTIEKHLTYPSLPVCNNVIPILQSQLPMFLSQVKSEEVQWFTGIMNNRITFIIPFAVKKRGIFKIGYFLTSVIHIYEKDKKPEKEFLELVIEDIKVNKECDWIEQPPTWVIFNTIPSNAKSCRFGSYIIDISHKNLDEIFKSFQDKTRRSISRAVREKVTVKTGIEYLKQCMYVFKHTSEREKIKYPGTQEIKSLVQYFKG